MTSIKDLYIVKYNSKVFEPETIVKMETCSDSGKCYLVSDINDTNKREWIMNYDLYPIDSNIILIIIKRNLIKLQKIL